MAKDVQNKRDRQLRTKPRPERDRGRAAASHDVARRRERAAAQLDSADLKSRS